MAEVMVSCVLLITMLGVMTPMVMRLGRLKLVHRELLVGQQELTNQMERLMATGSDQLKGGELAVAEEHQPFLREAKLQLVLQPEQNSVRARLELSWESRSGFRVAPRRLTAWIPREVVADDKVGDGQEGVQP